MTQRRWLRIIPVALIMYTIAYVDRTNIALALDPKISSMMKDLAMDAKMKGEAAGVFFLGYVLLQIPGGILAARWSARKLISLCLVVWGVCAVACGMSHTFRQFEVARFFLGIAESAVFPATLVLLANWFPRGERARANAYWQLCQPLAVAGSAPFTGWLLGSWGWQTMIMLEGALPFIWLPIWWFFIRDHPRDANWISAEERSHLESTLAVEGQSVEPPQKLPLWERLSHSSIYIMIVFYFLHNCAAYGCMTFFPSILDGQNFTALQHGELFAVPYVLTAVVMVVNSWHSDKTHERRGHVAAVYLMSGVSLILGVALRQHFWVSYFFMCFAIPGPFAGMAPFWAIPAETLPRNVMGFVAGLVNAVGNLGGFFGPAMVGALTKQYNSTDLPFMVLGFAMLGCTTLAFLLPKSPHSPQPAPAMSAKSSL